MQTLKVLLALESELGDIVDAFHEVYCVAYEMLDYQWLMQKASYLQFNGKLEAIVSIPYIAYHQLQILYLCFYSLSLCLGSVVISSYIFYFIDVSPFLVSCHSL